MLISRQLGLEHNDNHKSGYMVDTMPSPLSLAASVAGAGHSNISGSAQNVCAYQPGEGYFIPGRVQPDVTGMNMYPSQPEPSTINPPANYVPVPGSAGTAPVVMGSHYPTGLEHPSYYPSLGDGYDVKSGVGDIWSSPYPQSHHHSYYPYESGFAPQYPYERYCSMDINDGVRRKNATRESTNTLKAWLQEHKKNPYPTKGEKIMLAIITKMTLTQVSTWFANARRRLKKENKMTWVPKNRSNDSSNNSNSKKAKDDDVTSQHSQDDDAKSDIDNSEIDSDDSDDRKVTSTNNNDTTSTSGLQDLADYPSDRSSLLPDGISQTQDNNDFPAQTQSTPTDSNQPHYPLYDQTPKPWSPTNSENKQTSDDTLSQTGSSYNAPFQTDGYSGPPGSVLRAGSAARSALIKNEDANGQRDCKFSKGWSSVGYQDNVAVDSSSGIYVDKSSVKLETLPQCNPNAAETKPNYPYPLNTGVDGHVATSGIVSSSYYPHVFPGQSQQTPEYYSPKDRLPNALNIVPPSAYFSQLDVNMRQDHQQSNERIQAPFTSNRENLHSRTLTAPNLPTVSPVQGDVISPVQQPLYPDNLNNLISFHSTPNLTKSASSSSTDTVYSTQFYPHDAYGRLATNASSRNVDYYQRKNYSGADDVAFSAPTATPPRK